MNITQNLFSCLLLWIIVIFRSSSSDSDFHASTYHLHKFLNNEFRVIKLLRQLVAREEEKLDIIKEYINDFQELAVFENSAEEVVENPLAAYSILQHVSKRWDRIVNVLHSNTTLEYLSLLENHRSTSVIPSSKDLQGAALALLRIQEVYDWKPSELIEGKVPGLKGNYPLKLQDCAMISQQAFYQLRLETTKAWLNSCKTLMDQDDGTYQPILHKLETIVDALTSVSASRSGIRYFASNLLTLFPGFHSEAFVRFNEDERISNMKKRLDTAYQDLCKKKISLTSEEEAQFHCYLERNGYSSILKPWKVEYRFYDPLIKVYHNVLTENEIVFLKEQAAPKMEIAKVHRASDIVVETTTSRVGKMSWLGKSSHEIVKKIYRNAEDMTGLSTDSAEELQVLNYGIGGHYDVHLDHMNSYEKDVVLPTGDRLATILYYLNDVYSGGHTVFPDLGLSITPEKGSAVFWHNLLRSGKGDERTMHAGCPVVLGSKWIANIWIHEKGQEFLRPCSMNRLD